MFPLYQLRKVLIFNPHLVESSSLTSLNNCAWSSTRKKIRHLLSLPSTSPGLSSSFNMLTSGKLHFLTRRWPPRIPPWLLVSSLSIHVYVVAKWNLVALKIKISKILYNYGSSNDGNSNAGTSFSFKTKGLKLLYHKDTSDVTFRRNWNTLEGVTIYDLFFSMNFVLLLLQF